MPISSRAKPAKVRYPFATLAFYGPDDQRASKLVAAVFPAPDQEGPIRRWQSENDDVREDPAVTAEVTAFLKENSVVESAISEEILGCPHVQGVDYPSGGVCPECSFWWNKPQPNQTMPEVHRSLSKTGRNDPCPCGSGRKYKKCCGAPK